MTIQSLFAILLLLSLIACAEQRDPPSEDSSPSIGYGDQAGEVADQPNPKLSEVQVPVFDRQEVPSSERSIAAVSCVAPVLVHAMAQQGLAYGSPIFIRIFKEERELELWVQTNEGFRLFRTYRVAAMSGGLGPKLREGDRQAPEGFYYVPPSRMNPNSRFHLSFNLGYPNSYDRHHGWTGSALMVHGGRASIGCFAMTDPKIEDIYALADAALRNGQPFFRVHSFPFRMTSENMRRHAGSQWSAFWSNLKEGYDYFEADRQVPNVRLSGGRYVFEADTR